MAANRLNTHLWRLILAACITVTGLTASEHHGVVKSGGLPVPGATVTASQGDKKIVTTTDENGSYSFPELADGVWTVSVDSLGFVKTTRDVGVAPDAPSPMWDLKYETLEALTAPKSETTPAAAPAPTTAAATAPAVKTAETKPAETPAKAATTPGATATAATPAGKNAKNAKNSKTPAAPAAGANGRPSLNAALAGRGQSGGFTRLGVQGDGGDAGAVDAAPLPDMGDAANSSFTINGSVSSGLDMPQPGGDWFGGRGGPGGMDMGGGMMGPQGIPGMGPAGGDPTMNSLGADTAAGAGGRGGRGGGGAGGPGGGGPGGFGGGGGRGGGGMAGIPMAPGGGGGRGGRAGGGRGGPGGPGGRNPSAFGNNRRNPRSRYNFSASGNLTQSALNAESYSTSGVSVKKPSAYNLSTNLTAGGPLKLPKIGGTDKGTFTITYQLGRQRIGNANQQLLVPTDAERNGDFSQFVPATGQTLTLIDPSGHPYANNIIPTTSINPAAAALLKFYPEPNFFNNGRYNYAATTTGHSASDNVNLRLNYSFNTRNQINGSLQWQRSDTTTPNFFSFIDNATNNGVNASASYIYHFTTRLIATTRYNYSKNTRLSTPFFANKLNLAQQIGIQGTDQNPLNWGPPGINLSGSGFLGLSDGAESYLHPQTNAVGESLLWVHAKHEFTFGGDFSKRQNNFLSQANPRGQFTFNGSVTGLDMADFLVGVPTSASISFGNADKYYRSTVYDAFVNDQWRVNNQLSLQIGLRWDYQAPTVEKYNRMANIDVGPGFATAGIVTAGQIGPVTGQAYPNSLVYSKKTDFSPRIGFAWKPFPKHSTVVRGGWGLGFTPGVYQGLATGGNSLGSQNPFSKTASLQNSNCALSIQTALTSQSIAACTAAQTTAKTTALLNTYAVNPNLAIPYAQNWQLAIQQNLKWSLVATVTYFGVKGSDLAETIYPNTAPAFTFTKGTPIATQQAAELAAFPYLNNPGGYTYYDAAGSSHYNSLQGQLMRRSRSGFGANLTFSYSKGIDNSGTIMDWLNPSLDRARQAIPAETLSGNLTYSTGVGLRGGGLVNGWKGLIIKDWTINTGYNLGSGIPFTPTTSLQAVSFATSPGIRIRPNYTGAPLLLNSTLNPAAFAIPANGIWGDLGRNTVTGPITFTMNASAQRTFRLADRKSITFSLRAQNPLNHFMVTSWNSTVSTGQNNQFGQPLGYTRERQVSANVRISF